MPAPLSCEEFLDAVREAGILEEHNLSSFIDDWNNTFPKSNDTFEMADSMLKAGLLTNFQKENLLQGKRRGYIIADKYILLQHLGAGGMGSVWLCEHKVMRRRVAIKVLPSDFAKDPEYLSRFHREARAAAALDHPNIVRAFDVDHDEKLHFLVMEYVDGHSLQDLVDDQGPLEIAQAANYIAQAAAGLQHAHEAGLVHRDIKPANLLVDRKGIVKILDMGLALFFQEKGKSLTQQFDANAVLGTAEYLAPEQAIDSHGVDIRADVYSLGLTFFFLLTGKSPYGDEGTIAQKLIWHQLREPKSVKELRPEVPDAVAAIISKMLAKDRADRYQIPGDVAEVIQDWSQRGSLAPEPPPAAEPAVPEIELQAKKPRAGSPTMITRRGPDTIRSSDADTKVDRDRIDRDPEAEMRPKKKPRSDPHADGKRKPRSDKIDPDARRSAKEKPSAKHRRDKAPVGFWTTPRILMAASAGGVFAIAGLVILLVVLLRDPSKGAPVVQGPSRGIAPGDDKKPPQPDPGKKDPAPPTKVEPPKKDPTPPPKVDPPKKDPTPPPKVDPPKVDPPKKDPDKKPDPPKTVVTPVAKESLAPFFPKKGDALMYEVAFYTGPNSKMVQQEKWEFKDKDVLDVSILKYGVLDKDTLLKGASIKWMTQPSNKKDHLQYRVTDKHFEIGRKLDNMTAWEPVLPLSAAENDTWKWDSREYKVVKFDNTPKGRRRLHVRDATEAPQGGKIVTDHIFVQGLGEVSRSQSFEKAGSTAQLLAEARQVDPDAK